jgi:presequence protease
MSTFDLLRTHSIPSLQATLEEYLAPATGARHVHLATAQPDLAFLVAFPTIPGTSDGRAHILEHLALSGSERYPVRDPFFSMLRRSTSTFMNAMTYADRTVYPFASTDRKDFDNLLDVYLDATFFPRLEYLNFLQEGWRHVLEDGKLGYQGVVFNEMKGAFADPSRALYHGVVASLLAGTTYASVSGGDPLAIPDLTHAALKEFHATHYHPSQALFMTAGPVPAAEIQQRIAERVLTRLPGTAPLMTPQLAAVHAPRATVVTVPGQAGRADGHGIQLAWILGESADSAALHRANLLQAGLLGNASAPLRKAMETAGYGRPSRINGMDPNPRQLLFHLGMEGLTEDQVAPARARIWDALERAAVAGVPQDVLEATLRDIKYEQRDTSSGRMPNVLARMLRAVPVAMRGGDVHDTFDGERVLESLERQVADPAFFTGMVRALLDSPARVDATIAPDPDYFAKRGAAETARLAADEARLADADRARIAADNAALLALQGQSTDTAVLPRILPGDVDAQPLPLPAVEPATTADAANLFTFPIASNGISYARIEYDVSALPESDWPWLQLYADMRRGLGLAGMDYAEADAWRQRAVPVFSLQLLPAQVDGKLRLTLRFHVDGLREEHERIAEVLGAFIGSPRFDETERIAFLTAQSAQQRLNNLAQGGDQYAAVAAGAPHSPLRAFEHASVGIKSLPFRAALQRLAATPEGAAQVGAQLARIHALVLACPATVVCAGSGGDAADLARLVKVPASGAPAAGAVLADLGTVPPILGQGGNLALQAPGQANHCHIAWPAPTVRHEDAPALAVAAELLTHRFLHRAIREQGGAYGGGAAYASGAGLFTMKSYRDPRLKATYADFARALDAFVDADFSQEQLEEAIISVIKNLDRPGSPFDAAMTALDLYRRGIGPGERARFRAGVLGCTAAHAQEAVQRWLRSQPGTRAAFVANAEQDLDGLTLVELPALFQEPSAPA